MASINKVILVGNLGKDPEIRRFESNSIKASFPLATTESYKDRNGDWQENTEWHNVVAWSYTAEKVEKWLKKGMQVYVEGKLTTRSYDDQDGNKKYITEVVGQNIIMLGRKGENEGSGSYAETSSNTPAPTQPEIENDEADDLPF
jgi:single-strand DNA-binding protein